MLRKCHFLTRKTQICEGEDASGLLAIANAGKARVAMQMAYG